MGWPDIFYLSKTKMMNVCVQSKNYTKKTWPILRWAKRVETSAELSFLPKITFKNRQGVDSDFLRPKDIRDIYDWYYILHENTSEIISYIKGRYRTSVNINDISEADVIYAKGVIKIDPQFTSKHGIIPYRWHDIDRGRESAGYDTVPVSFTVGEHETIEYKFELTLSNIVGLGESGARHSLIEMAEEGSSMSGLFAVIHNKGDIRLSPYMLMPSYSDRDTDESMSSKVVKLLTED